MNKRSANDTEETLNLQPLKRTKNKIYSCNDCEFETPNATEMFTHKTTHYTGFLCGINNCESVFDLRHELTKHFKEHKDSNNKFVCNYKDCIFTTVNHKSMQFHTITHSIEDTFVCGIINCQETFGSLDMLHKHRDTHKIDGKYICDICNYSTTDAYHFQIHRITHLEIRPFKCDDCDSTFASQNLLDIHTPIHAGARKFVCKVEICKASFKSSSSLAHHKQFKHSDFKGFKCPTCNNYFLTKSTLDRHINSQHAKEKTIFKCEECDQQYPRKDSLVQHIRDHHEAKRFKCDHCSFASNRLGNLGSHIETHERHKSYTFVCDMQDGGTQKCSLSDIPCTIRCKTQLDLEYHIERNHTFEGLKNKFESETKLASFLKSKNINFTRDHENTIRFTTCKNIDPTKKSARPDFYLICKSAELGCYFIVENDEFAHRRNSCDFSTIV
jgi:uncharacterized Zn-finger protein